MQIGTELSLADLGGEEQLCVYRFKADIQDGDAPSTPRRRVEAENAKNAATEPGIASKHVLTMEYFLYQQHCMLTPLDVLKSRQTTQRFSAVSTPTLEPQRSALFGDSEFAETVRRNERQSGSLADSYRERFLVRTKTEAMVQQAQLINTYVRGLKAAAEVNERELGNYEAFSDFAQLSQNVFCAQMPKTEFATHLRLFKTLVVETEKSAGDFHVLYFAKEFIPLNPANAHYQISYFKVRTELPTCYQIAQAVTLIYESLLSGKAVLLIGHTADQAIGTAISCFYALMANILRKPVNHQQIISTFNIRRKTLANKLVATSVARYVNCFLELDGCVSDKQHINYRCACYPPLSFSGFRVSKPLPSLRVQIQTTDGCFPMLSTPLKFHEPSARSFNNKIITWELDSFVAQTIRAEASYAPSQPAFVTEPFEHLQWDIPENQRISEVSAKVYERCSQPQNIQIVLRNEVVIKAFSGQKLVDSCQVFLGMWPTAGLEFTGLVSMDNGLQLQFLPGKK